jgi:mannose-P-dolichol utilization defect protein 1
MLIPVGFLQAATLPISLLSKAPQIISNHRAKSTGNLSAFAVFNALLGCLARLFTTQQEVNDPLVLWGFLGAALLNLVLAAQMVAYWQNTDGSSARRRSADDGVMEGLGNVKGNGDFGGLGGLGKRWERKLD